MRGSIRRRKENVYSLITERPSVVDPVTGKRTRRQRWETFHGTQAQAEARLAELVTSVARRRFIEPSKVTLTEWLRRWLAVSVKPNNRGTTYRTYASIVEQHVARHDVGDIRVQELQPSDLEKYLAEVGGMASSLQVHVAVLSRAMKKAAKDRVIDVSPAIALERRRSKTDAAQTARTHCWSASEARQFLDIAKTASPQTAAFCYLALDTGARKGELAGLRWSDVDFDAGTVVIERQLDSAGVTPVFGPTKTGKSRTVSLGDETITQLRAHRQSQNELKMKNRSSYTDHGLVFSKEVEDCRRPEAALGQPIETLSEARFQRLIVQAGVKRIKFHGCRHTCATLSLQAGVLPHVVAEGLGHDVTMLLKVYAHALPDARRDAAARRSALLHGGR